MIEDKKQKLMLFCQDGYLSAGSTIAYCDGRQWDRELGECRPDNGHTKSCDFETSNLCEWTQDTENDFPWIRKSGWTSYEKLEFGPKHDHTVMNCSINRNEGIHLDFVILIRLENRLKVIIWLLKPPIHVPHKNHAFGHHFTPKKIHKMHAFDSIIICMDRKLGNYE